MYGENTKTIAIPIYRVLPYPVMYVHVYVHVCGIFVAVPLNREQMFYMCGLVYTC